MQNCTRLLAAAALGFATAAPAALPAAIDGQNLPSLAPMLERVTPGVVNIATRGRVRVQENPLLSDPFFRRFFDLPDRPRERQTQSLGSGVVIDAQQGLVVTNHHVIARADEITVTLRDGRRLQATLVGGDAEADVAVIRVPPENLTAVPVADSDTLRVGDFVVAIGNPFGLGQTVTSGIVSALGRTGLGIEGYEDFIQTDASINPGNSGGALVNLRGELVGINTAILAPSGGNVGIGFAIPTNMARQIVEQLVKHGEVRRGRLGVSAQDLDADLARAFAIPMQQGAVITRVEDGSPAARAGLQAGDVVVTVNGRPVRGSFDMRNAVGLLRVGERIDMEVLRGGKRLRISAVVAEPEVSSAAGKAIHPRLAGATLANLATLRPGAPEAVVVQEVAGGSPAQAAGLRAGDLIVSANRKPVRNLDELARAVDANAPLLLNLQRGNAALFVLLK